MRFPLIGHYTYCDLRVFPRTSRKSRDTEKTAITLDQARRKLSVSQATLPVFAVQMAMPMQQNPQQHPSGRERKRTTRSFHHGNGKSSAPFSISHAHHPLTPFQICSASSTRRHGGCHGADTRGKGNGCAGAGVENDGRRAETVDT
jgi:hypothetical protein